MSDELQRCSSLELNFTTDSLQSIFVKKTGKTLSTMMQFVTYGVVNGKERSGAYLFLPDGDAKVSCLLSLLSLFDRLKDFC